MPGWPCTHIPVLDTSPVRSHSAGSSPTGSAVCMCRPIGTPGGGAPEDDREREQPAQLAGGAGVGDTGLDVRGAPPAADPPPPAPAAPADPGTRHPGPPARRAGELPPGPGRTGGASVVSGDAACAPGGGAVERRGRCRPASGRGAGQRPVRCRASSTGLIPTPSAAANPAAWAPRSRRSRSLACPARCSTSATAAASRVVGGGGDGGGDVEGERADPGALGLLPRGLHARGPVVAFALGLVPAGAARRTRGGPARR